MTDSTVLRVPSPDPVTTPDAPTITAGSPVRITDAYGKEHDAEALSGVEIKGHSFPVIWVNARRADGTTERMPWPAESVRLS